MAQNSTTDTNTSTLSAAEQKTLVDFKAMLNKEIPVALPAMAAWGTLMYENTNSLDPAFLSTMDATIFDKSKIALSDGLKAIKEKYDTLPASITNEISTHLTFFAKPSNHTPILTQAKAVINSVQKYLGVEETDDLIFDEGTSRFLKDKLKDLKEQNSDITTDFAPQKFDGRTLDFLNDLVKKRMQDAGVSDDDLNATIIQIWSLEQGPEETTSDTPERKLLGEAVSLRNAMQFLLSGNLPSGALTPRPPVDAPWETNWSNNNAPDRFFSAATYKSLHNSSTVSRDTLFLKHSSNPNAELLKGIADRLGIDTNSARISETDVGRIAIEVMAHQANELCIDEKDINNAIHRGDFMPHLDDLLLVDKGLGLPDSIPHEAFGRHKDWELEFVYRTDTIKHRSSAFAERFGEMDDEFVAAHKLIKFNATDAFTRSSMQSPVHYYGAYKGVTGNTNDTYYEAKRSNTYLPKLSERVEEDTIGGLCNGDPEIIAELTEGEGGCSVEETLANMAAPCDSGATTGCSVENTLSKVVTACGAEFTSKSQASDDTSAAITANIEDATGSAPCGSTEEILSGITPPCKITSPAAITNP